MVKSKTTERKKGAAVRVQRVVRTRQPVTLEDLITAASKAGAYLTLGLAPLPRPPKKKKKKKEIVYGES